MLFSRPSLQPKIVAFLRFALEFVIVSNAQVTNEPIRESTKTLDDEHTPGIFQVLTWSLYLFDVLKLTFISF